MKRNQRSNLQFNVKDYDFLITLEALRTSYEMDGIYKLQLEKGGKHIQSLTSSIEFGRNHIYLFQLQKPISVKVYKEKNMSFSWSLYRYVEDKVEFVDSFNTNFQDYYLRYIEELKNSSFQYSRICQSKDGGQPFGNSWMLMKLHLKYYQFRQVLKSSTGSITLELKVDIFNEFDRIALIEARKSQKKIDPEFDDRSTSSKNSLRDKKKKVKFTEQQQLPKEKLSELKVESLIKIEPEPKQDQITSKSIIVEQQQRESCEDVSQTFLPIKQALLKSKTILSDIIEASNQGESHLNPGNRSDRKPSQCLLEPPIVVKTFSKTNTYHFENTEQAEPIELKRKNSYEDFHRSHQEEDPEETQLIRVSEVSEASKDQLTKESTIIHVQQTPKPIALLKADQSIKKYVLLILAIYIILGGLLYSNLKGKVNIESQFSKKPRIKKDKLEFDQLFHNFS